MNVAYVKIDEIFLKWILKIDQHHLTDQLAQSKHIESKFVLGPCLESNHTAAR